MLQSFHLGQSGFLKTSIVLLEAVLKYLLLFLNYLSYCQTLIGIVKLIIKHRLCNLSLHGFSLLVKFVLVWILWAEFVILELHSRGPFVFISWRHNCILRN